MAVLLNPAVPDDQVRASVFRRVEREALAAALADCERLVRPPDDNFEAELLSRYAMVRQFLPSLLATVDFEASPAGQPALGAVAALRVLEGRKKVGFDEVPAEILTPAWRRLAGQPGRPLDRRAYTFAVLERLRAALRARDVFVPRSQRWSDPRAKLLACPAWEATRARVCRTLGLSAEPAAALPQLAPELDEAYCRTAGRLATNTAVELDAGKLKLSKLERLDEPESLVSLSERVGALLPRIDLPDLLAEVAAWTGFADQFTHVSEASARVDDLELSVCAVLVADAANVGLEPLARPDVGALTRGRLSWVAQNYLRAETLGWGRRRSTARAPRTGSRRRRPPRRRPTLGQRQGGVVVDEAGVGGQPPLLRRRAGCDLPQLHLRPVQRVPRHRHPRHLEEFGALWGEVEAWRRRRDPAQAAAEGWRQRFGGCRTLRCANLALALMGDIGPDVAGAEVRTLATDPSTHGFAMCWLVDHGLEEQAVLFDPDDPSWFVDVLVQRLVTGEPDSRATPWTSPATATPR